MQQGSPEWLQARLGIITGTYFHDCRNTTTRKTLIEQKLAEHFTQKWNEATSKSMDWGKEKESEAVAEYSFEYSVDVDHASLVYHKDTDMVAMSPDGLVGDDGTIEVKCPFTSKEHINHILNGLPTKYKPQVQGGLWVTERKWCDFISYDPRMPPGMELYVKRIPRDDDYIDLLEESVMATVSELENLIKNLSVML